MKEKLTVTYIQSHKNAPVLELLNYFSKSSTVAHKRAAYKRNCATV